MLEKATIPCGQGVWGTLETPRRDAEQAAERTGAAECTGVGPNREVLLGDTYLQTVHMQTGDEGRARMSSPRERAVGLALWSPDTRSCRLGLSSKGPLMMDPDLSRGLDTAWNCIHFYNTLESILFQLPHHEMQDEGSKDLKMNGSTLEDSPNYRAGGEHDPGEVRSELGPGEEAGISQALNILKTENKSHKPSAPGANGSSIDASQDTPAQCPAPTQAPPHDDPTPIFDQAWGQQEGRGAAGPDTPGSPISRQHVAWSVDIQLHGLQPPVTMRKAKLRIKPTQREQRNGASSSESMPEVYPLSSQ
ncbi:Neuronal Cell Adhesion Molecule [Manis pentadactyla]|nr:Neuronal Cell Adhesion Molecule [Manis pentadactyla]